MLISKCKEHSYINKGNWKNKTKHGASPFNAFLYDSKIWLSTKINDLMSCPGNNSAIE